ncbi:MAG: MmcQ/YjbR family DNA-binding protein [Actinomycetes bacterium]
MPGEPEPRWGQREYDAALAQLRLWASTLPGVEVVEGHGSPTLIHRGRRFVWLTADHHGDGRLALWIRALPGRQSELVAAEPERYFVPPYLGPKGWVGVQVDTADERLWADIDDLVEQGWRMDAAKGELAAWESAPPSA